MFLQTYKKLLQKNFAAFMVVWFILAMSPVFLLWFFEKRVVQDIFLVSQEYLLTLGLVAFVILCSSISLSVWAAFHRDISNPRKFILIVASYIMIWLAFGNLYYFGNSLHNFLVVVRDLPSDSASVVLGGLPDFWQQVNIAGDQLGYVPVNSWTNYVNCLYLSAVTITTIGYGDIVPLTSLSKIFVTVEAMSGQMIMVVAIGIWFSNKE